MIMRYTRCKWLYARTALAPTNRLSLFSSRWRITRKLRGLSTLTRSLRALVLATVTVRTLSSTGFQFRQKKLRECRRFLGEKPSVSAIGDRTGIFAAYGAGLGAAGGAFAAGAKGDKVDSGFELGAAFGAAVLGIVGGTVEYFRLTRSYETKEAGDANDKMTIIALKDKNILYTGYSAIGYVYFPRGIVGTSSKSLITVRFVRGDPSKDWLPPSFHTIDEQYFGDGVHDKKESQFPKRPREADYSPLVCECPMALTDCSNLKYIAPLNCTAANGESPDDDCQKIGNGSFAAGLSTTGPGVSKTLPKCSSDSIFCP
jgi:hypothetical protein